MIWPPTIETLRERIGLEPDDTSRDADLLLALDTALSHVEVYLDRKLALSDEEETFHHQRGEILLRRYPIASTSAISFTGYDGSNLTLNSQLYVDIDYEKGIVYNITPRGIDYVKVAYTGGYDNMPDALYWAIMAVFDAVWAGTPGFGGSTGAIVAEGDVKKISLVGIGTVELDTGSSASGGSGSGGGLAASPWGLIPATVISILDLYRRESAVGVG